MNVIVFGANGYLGQNIVENFRSLNNNVISVSRSSLDTDIQISVNLDEIAELKIKFDGCVWAQGVNLNDNLQHSEFYDQVLESNLNFIIKSIRVLLNSNLLQQDARLTVISSVWQNLGRQNKFSYMVSKSAVEGLVNSFLADYSQVGYSINAVLPGVIDSPMTRQVLSQAQLKKIIDQMPNKKLVTARQVSQLVTWLTSKNAAGINGQFIRIDNGWSSVRVI